MSNVKVAINGFGRIGRLVFRQIYDMDGIEVVAVNDLTDPATLAHLLKYDTTQGRFNQDIKAGENSIIVNGHEVKIYAEKDPAQIPWGKHDVDVVLECTGRFTDAEKAKAHLEAGAKKVVISAPAKGEGIKTIVFNVNHDILDGSEKIISCASCTTNCLAPMAKVLNDKFGIESGLMSTIHSFTNDQNTLDAPHPKDLRRARAASQNIIPTTTGATKAVAIVIPELKGRLNGSAQRVPTATGSVTEFYTVLKKKVTVDEINQAMKDAANESFGYNTDEIVSSDIIGMRYGSLFDATQTMVLDGIDNTQLIKTVSWYDNEMSYVSQLVRTVKYFAGLISK